MCGFLFLQPKNAVLDQLDSLKRPYRCMTNNDIPRGEAYLSRWLLGLAPTHPLTLKSKKYRVKCWLFLRCSFSCVSTTRCQCNPVVKVTCTGRECDSDITYNCSRSNMWEWIIQYLSTPCMGQGNMTNRSRAPRFSVKSGMYPVYVFSPNITTVKHQPNPN